MQGDPRLPGRLPPPWCSAWRGAGGMPFSGKHFHVLCTSGCGAKRGDPWSGKGAAWAVVPLGHSWENASQPGQRCRQPPHISMHRASRCRDSRVGMEAALKSLDRKLKTPGRICPNLSPCVQEKQLLLVLGRPSSTL